MQLKAREDLGLNSIASAASEGKVWMQPQGKGKPTLPGEAYRSKGKYLAVGQGTLSDGTTQYISTSHLPPSSSDFICISSLVHIPRTIGCHRIRSLLWQQGQDKHP